MMYDPRKGFLLEPKHSETCYLDTQGRREFIVRGKVIYRDRIGRRNGHGTSWEGFRCNCSECPAVLYVRWDVLMDFLSAGAS